MASDPPRVTPLLAQNPAPRRSLTRRIAGRIARTLMRLLNTLRRLADAPASFEQSASFSIRSPVMTPPPGGIWNAELSKLLDALLVSDKQAALEDITTIIPHLAEGSSNCPRVESFKAKQAIRNGQPVSASIGANPETELLCHYWIALDAFLRGKRETAISHLQRAVALDQMRLDSLILLGEIAFPVQPDLCWRSLIAAAGESRRTVMWRALAAATNTPDRLVDYLSLWNRQTLAHPDLKRSINNQYSLAVAALNAGNVELADQTMHIQLQRVMGMGKKERSIAQKMMDRHRSSLTMPLWLGISERTEFPEDILPSSRHLEALRDACHALGGVDGMLPIALESTLLGLARNDLSLCRFTGHVLGVAGSAAFSEASRLIGTSGRFVLQSYSSSDDVHEFQHVCGAKLTLTMLAPIADGFVHRIGQLSLLSPSFGTRPEQFDGIRLLVPERIDDYLSFRFGPWEHIDAPRSAVIDYLNSSPIDLDRGRLEACYEAIGALLREDQRYATRCMRAIARFGGGDRYANLAPGINRYAEPTAEEIMESGIKAVMHLSGLENVAYQGNMWIPVLERLSTRCAIVIRERRIADQLDPTTLPIYFLDKQADLDLLEQAGVRTVLYPGNAQKNAQLLRFFKMSHFFINHGESDKAVNQSKFLMAYDKLLVAGPLAEKRLRAAGLPIRNGQVEHVGRPQVELALERRNSSSQIRTVLYAPTWEGFNSNANYTSVGPYGLAMLETLKASGKFRILFKPHPYTGHEESGAVRNHLEKMKSLADGENFMLYDTKKPIFELMNDSDILITDVSSVLNDYLYTLKPMIITNPRGDTHAKLEHRYPSSVACYKLDDPAEVLELIALAGSDDPLAAARELVCRESLGDFDESSLVRFDRVLAASIDAAGTH